MTVLGACAPAQSLAPSTGAPPSSSSSSSAAAPGSAGPSAPAASSPASSAASSTAALVRIGSLGTPRAGHTATLLPDGRILVAGGCTRDSCEGTTETTEIVDPAPGSSAPGPAMGQPRVGHAAVTLADGRVLLIGGFTASGVTETTEVFDPATASFAPGPNLTQARADPVVLVLDGGSILVAGGFDGRASLASAEMLARGADAFAPTGSMAAARSSHAGASLPDGRALVAGGSTGGAADEVLATAEIFDPATGSWAPTGNLTTRRHKTAAIALEDRRVLVVGGSDERDGFGRYASAEMYDPATGSFTGTAEMAAPRYKLAAAVATLADGRVLIAGGAPAAEVFDPGSGTFQAVPTGAGANPDQSFATAVPLADGSVVVIGGYDSGIHLTDQVLRFAP